MKVWPAVKVETFGTTAFGAVGVLLSVAAPDSTSEVALRETRILLGNSKVIEAASEAVLEIYLCAITLSFLS